MNPRIPFKFAEWAAIAAIILIWGLNNGAAKVATEHLPPLLMGAARFGISLIFLAPFLRPPFPTWRQVLPIMLLAGPLHYGLIYIGFSMIHNLSPMVVALQLWIPMSAFFAWRLLGETMRPSALIGMILALAGVVWMSLDPKGADDLPGIAIGVGASSLWALATILVRKAPNIKPLKMQALTSLAATPLLLAASLAFEPDAPARAVAAPTFVWGLVIWAALASTLGASALLFWLVQKHEPGRITPWFLLTPLLSCAIGVGVLGDRLTPQLALGGLATLAGVALVALAERRDAVRRQSAT